MKSKQVPPVIAAFHFLTGLPVTKRKVSLEAAARGLWAFPLIGLFTGILLSLSAFCVSIVFPAPLAAAFILCIWVLLTGALHVDGFIDCCDALFASKTKTERLDILKDVSTGSFGTTGAVLLFILKYSCILSIHPAILLIILPLATITGRSAILYAMYRFPYARTRGLGKLFKDNIKIRDLIISLFLLLLTAGGFIFFHAPFYLGFIVIAVQPLFIELFGFRVLKKIPGFTGDVYGAVCELTELLTLLIAVPVIRFFS